MTCHISTAITSLFLNNAPLPALSYKYYVYNFSNFHRVPIVTDKYVTIGTQGLQRNGAVTARFADLRPVPWPFPAHPYDRYRYRDGSGNMQQ